MKVLVEYYKDTGKYYTEAFLDHEYDPSTFYIEMAVSKIRGLRDNGGPGALPGLCSDGWEGPIRVSADGCPPRILLPGATKP